MHRWSFGHSVSFSLYLLTVVDVTRTARISGYCNYKVASRTMLPWIKAPVIFDHWKILCQGNNRECLLHIFNFISCKYYIAQICTHTYVYVYICVYLSEYGFRKRRGGGQQTKGFGILLVYLSMTWVIKLPSRACLTQIYIWPPPTSAFMFCGASLHRICCFAARM